MTSPPKLPASGASAFGKENPSLNEGLAALKQGKYADAIAHLEGVCEVELEPTLLVRAQMGLVVAYERSGDAQKAIALCQQLSQSTNAQVKQWAVRTLAGLTNRSPKTAARSQPSTKKAPASDATGFVPLDSTSQTSEPSPRSQPSAKEAPASDATGFVPLDPKSSTPPTRARPKVQPPKEPGSNLNPNPSSLKGEGSNLTPTPTSSIGEVDAEGSRGEVASPLQKTQAPTPAPKTSPRTTNREPVKNQEPEKRASPPTPTWRQAERAKRWQPLPLTVGFKPEAIQLWGVQLFTAIALFWLLRLILPFAASITNHWLVQIPNLTPFQALYDFYYEPTWPLLIGLGLLLVVSPWLLDRLLKLFYGSKRLPEQTLVTHSSEAVSVLKRICRERRLPSPTLGVLPTAAPIAFSYGNLPHTARIVVSQGLLDQLADDEIAAIYAAQMGHIIRWDFVLMSLGVVVTQLPYLVYWQVSQWGERWEGPILRGTFGAIASLAYGLYWLLRWPFVWLSRLRIYYSDRFAAETTGNPNGLSRALLKIAIGVAQDIEKQGQTSWLLESFDLLTPLGHRQAMTLGSVYPHAPFETLLAWDWLNPDRRWLAINNFHPILGDRLQILAHYARYWKLETELDLPKPSLSKQKSKLFLQGAPYFGMMVGLGLAALLWLIGGIGILMRFRPIDWMWGDRSLLFGCILMGLSAGILIRINSFFPDIQPATLRNEPSLPDLLANPDALPVDSQPVRLQGKLLGRRGISNWLGQDLIIQLSPGLVKLHYLSWLGSIGNLLPLSARPSELVSRVITVTGWFRRGATTWIDFESLRTQGGKTTQGGHPVWSTILALAAALWGAYTIYRGV